MYYGARDYDPKLGRFIQPDTIVPEPGNPQALNRYSYVNNRPTVLIDPTGYVAHPNCQGSGAAIADCGVDGWFGYEDYAVRKQLREIGQREGDKVARALLDVVSALFEPADYAATIGACLSGECSILAVGAMALPFVPGVVGRSAGEVVEFANDTVLKRAFRNDQDRFLRKGESGLSVYIGATDEQISAHLQGDVLSVTFGEVRDLGMTLAKTPGAIEDLDPFHFEIVKGLGQTWNQFKNALKTLAWRK